jgi:uncharacterized MAPEG superfamily protein
VNGEDYRAQRRAGIGWIVVGGLVAAALWFAIDRLSPPLTGMETFTARMAFALKCVCLAVLFCLVAGVEAVAHERLVSPAFDPLAGYETRRLRVNQRFLQNTLEQIVIFAAGLFGLAAYCVDGRALRAIVASTAVWILARFAFWIGYHRSAAGRGLGMAGMVIGMIQLLYVAYRFGGELAGPWGAVAPVALFIALEVVLVLTARSRP